MSEYRGCALQGARDQEQRWKQLYPILESKNSPSSKQIHIHIRECRPATFVLAVEKIVHTLPLLVADMIQEKIEAEFCPMWYAVSAYLSFCMVILTSFCES